MRAKVEQVFSATAKKFEASGYAKLKSMVDYAGGAAGPMFDWSNPSSYTTALVSKPYEWIRDWWRRRPLTQFFDVAREFRRIDEYNLLIQKVFGIECDIADIRRFEKAVKTIHGAFRKVRDNAGKL